jgi:hypothetical protein
MLMIYFKYINHIHIDVIMASHECFHFCEGGLLPKSRSLAGQYIAIKAWH